MFYTTFNFVEIDPSAINFKKITYRGSVKSYFDLQRRKPKEKLVKIIKLYDFVKSPDDLRRMTLANLIVDFSMLKNARRFLDLGDSID